MGALRRVRLHGVSSRERLTGGDLEVKEISGWAEVVAGWEGIEMVSQEDG